jgi:hypothetical protein
LRDGRKRGRARPSALEELSTRPTWRRRELWRKPGLCNQSLGLMRFDDDNIVDRFEALLHTVPRKAMMIKADIT